MKALMSIIVFVAAYSIIVSEKVNKTIVAILGAACVLCFKLATFEQAGATVQLLRDGQQMDIIIQPIMLPAWEDDLDLWEFEDEYYDTTDGYPEEYQEDNPLYYDFDQH